MYDYISVNLKNILMIPSVNFIQLLGTVLDFPLNMVIFGSYVNVERLYFVPCNAYQIPLIQQ